MQNQKKPIQQKKPMQNFTAEKWADKIALFIDNFGFLSGFFWHWTIALPSPTSHLAMLHSKIILSDPNRRVKVVLIGFSLFWSRCRTWGNISPLCFMLVSGFCFISIDVYICPELEGSPPKKDKKIRNMWPAPLLVHLGIRMSLFWSTKIHDFHLGTGSPPPLFRKSKHLKGQLWPRVCHVFVYSCPAPPPPFRPNCIPARRSSLGPPPGGRHRT